MTNFVQRFALVTVLAVASLWSAGCSSSVTRTRMDRFGWRSTWTGRPCYRRIGGSLPCTPRVTGRCLQSERRNAGLWQGSSIVIVSVTA
jgi:hypothetical protein